LADRGTRSTNSLSMARRRNDLPDPDRVFANQVPVRIDQLFDLIHAVNPSERGLTGHALAGAYATKARLQSLLIERFGDDLRIEEVHRSAGQPPDEGDIVGIVHRTYRKDACHALVRQLSARAQAWVRWQRDTAAEAPGATADPAALPATDASGRRASDTDDSDASSPAAILDRGERLLAQYDYDAARTQFEAVLAAKHPAEPTQQVRAARLLLGLLVEHLADDAAALALQTKLPRPLLTDPAVGCLLATAAARTGDLARATGFLADHDGERADAAAIALAEAHLAHGDLDDCARLLAHVPPSSASAPAAQRLHSALRAARAATCRDLEAALAQALLHDDDQTDRLAHQILAIDPDHIAARAALRNLRRTREQSAIADTFREVQLHVATGDLAAARTAFLRLPANAPDHDVLGSVLQAAEQRAAAAARDRAIADLVGQLDAAITLDVIAELHAADADTIAAVRARIASPAARWLLTFEPRRSRGDQAAVAAAIVHLVEAEQLAGTGDQAKALRLLAPHAAILRCSPRARSFLDALEQHENQERRRVAAETLAVAEVRAVAEPAAAAELLRDIDPRLLDPPVAARREELLARVDAAVTLAAEQNRLRGALDGDDLSTACASLQRLIQFDASAGDRTQEIAAFERQIRARFVMARCEGDDALSDLLPLPPPPTACLPAQGLRTGVVLAEQRGARVFVRTAHLDPRDNRSFVVHPPAPFSLLHVHAESDAVLWLVGREAIVQMDLDTGAPRTLLPFAALHQVHDVECALPVGRHKVWVGTPAGVFLVDRARWITERRIDDFQRLCPLWGHREAMVVYSRHLHGYVRTDALGRGGFEQHRPFLLHGAVARPSGSGAALLYSRWKETAGEVGPMLQIAALLPNNRGYGEVDLGHVRADSRVELVTSSTAERVFVVAEMTGSGRQLIAVELGDRGVAEHWRVPVPELRLLGDAEGRAAFALHDDGDRVVLHELTAECPKPGGDAVAPGWRAARPMPERLPDVAPAIARLGARMGNGEEAAGAWTEREYEAACRDLLPLLDAGVREQRVLGFLASGPDEVKLLAAQRAGMFAGAGSEVVARLWSLANGRAPGAVLLRAQQRAGAGDPAGALVELADVELTGATAGMVAQLARLRSACHLAAGDASAARAELHAAAVGESAAALPDAFAAWLDELQPARRREATAAPGTLREFLGCIRAAERHLDASDHPTALAPLDQPAIWRQRDVQAIARLAAAWLGIGEGAGAVARVRRDRALAEFVALFEANDPWNGNRLGESSWPLARLAGIARAAEACLGAGAGGPRLDDVRPYVRTATSDPVLALTGTAGVATGLRRRVMHRSELAGFFDDYTVALLDQAKACWDRRHDVRMAGFVLEADLPSARALADVASRLLGIEQALPCTAVAVPLGAALRRLSTSPGAVGALLSRPILEGPFRRFALVYMGHDAIGFGNITE